MSNNAKQCVDEVTEALLAEVDHVSGDFTKLQQDNVVYKQQMEMEEEKQNSALSERVKTVHRSNAWAHKTQQLEAKNKQFSQKNKQQNQISEEKEKHLKNLRESMFLYFICLFYYYWSYWLFDVKYMWM